MISAYTAPGTKVVCINNNPDAFRIPGVIYDDNFSSGFSVLNVGETYTVMEIKKCPSSAKSGFVAMVAEIEWDPGFDIGRFNYPEKNKISTSLPESLTKLLDTRDIDELVSDKELETCD